jgi:hypothetical protein
MDLFCVMEIGHATLLSSNKARGKLTGSRRQNFQVACWLLPCVLFALRQTLWQSNCQFSCS